MDGSRNGLFNRYQENLFDRRLAGKRHGRVCDPSRVEATLRPNIGSRPSSLARPLVRTDRGLQPYRRRLYGPRGPALVLRAF